MDHDGKIGCGGLLRDNTWKWIKGFSKFIGTSNNIYAELWVVLAELQSAQRGGYKKVLIQVDNNKVTTMLQDVDLLPHIGFNLLMHIK